MQPNLSLCFFNAFCNTCHPNPVASLLHSPLCLSIPLSLLLAISFPYSPAPRLYKWVWRKWGHSSSVLLPQCTGKVPGTAPACSPGITGANPVFSYLEAVLQFSFCRPRWQPSCLRLERAHPIQQGWGLPSARREGLESQPTRKSWRKGTDGRRETT